MRRSSTSGRQIARRFFAVTWVAAALAVSACAQPRLPAEASDRPDPGQSRPAPEPGPAPAAEDDAGNRPRSGPEPVPAPPPASPVPPLPPTVAQAPAERPPAVAPAPPPDAGGAVRVALLLPLSGGERALGQALLDAALIALFEVGGDRLALLPRDTGGTPDGARAAAEAALREGARLILGPVFAAAAAAAAGPARERGVNVVAFSTDPLVAGDGVYLLGFMPDQQVERVVGFAARRGIRRYAALAPETPYGGAVVAAFEDAILRNGGRISRIERYRPDADDYFEPVRRLAGHGWRRDPALPRREGLAAVPPDVPLEYGAVMLADGGSRLRAIAPLLPFHDIDPAQVRFLGTGLWDEPMLGREPALVGGWFASPPPEAAAAFAERFEELHGYAPPRIASVAYDAVALAAALARGAAAPDFSATALTQPSGFAGVDGIFRFGRDGIAERGLAVIEVRPQGLRVIDEAPQTFAPGGAS